MANNTNGLRILAMEPYYGGSHQAFIDGWSDRSRHSWQLLTLPAYKWKWRMRHSAITFAKQVNALYQDGQRWDVIFCSDMLNTAEFLGLVEPAIRTIPLIVYFHENQLTYPVRFESERDYQFAVTNMTTALSADAVWFNSGFHRDEFTSGLEVFLRKMPDHQPFEAIDTIRAKANVQPPGISLIEPVKTRPSNPPVILWAARWEHDKNPEDFFKAVSILQNQYKLDFKLNVIGESFRKSPKIFKTAHKEFADRIHRWGFQKSADEYRTALQEGDIVVSTAVHEFFGLGMLEAASAGARPLLPRRLSYPELFGEQDDFFYDGSVDDLAKKLSVLVKRCADGKLWEQPDQAVLIAQRYDWKKRANDMDNELETLTHEKA